MRGIEYSETPFFCLIGILSEAICAKQLLSIRSQRSLQSFKACRYFAHDNECNAQDAGAADDPCRES